MRVRVARHPARPPGVKDSGHPRRVVVLARTPVVRDFKVQQSQKTHSGEGLDTTNRRTMGLLDSGHAGHVENCPGGDLLDMPRYLYGGSGILPQINPGMVRQGSVYMD